MSFVAKGRTLLRHFVKPCRLVLLIALLCAIPSAAYSYSRTIEPGLTAELISDQSIYLKACASEEYDVSDWAHRVLAKPEERSRFVSGDCLRIPLYKLTEEYQLEVIRALFKDDSHDDHGWIHKVTYVSSRRRGGETLWNISKWFTGDAKNYSKILSYNRMPKRASLYKGTKIKIPLKLLRPSFKEPILLDIAARRAAEDPSSGASRLNGELFLKTDARGPYASYRMKKGDTIYSKVVMRYTDRIIAKDVMEAANVICARSGIRRPEKIKAGDEVRIPLDLLSTMYLPRDDPRRREYERVRQEAAQYSNPVETAELKGILVILDPGHGGKDPGAVGRNRVYEDEVVYDIVCRIKQLLEGTTRARVVTTLVDKSRQYDIRDDSNFPRDTDEYVLTHPVYRNESAKVSAHLRWYLANSIYRKAVAGGTSPDKIVFASFHADALYYKSRGTMLYVPGVYYCKGNGGKSGYVYTSRSEVKEKQYVQIAYKDRIRSEGLSSELAKGLVASLHHHDIRVHSGKPVRNHIVKGRRSYVPAVIRHNIVPTKVLVEVVNLKNSEDCRLVADPAFREKYARAFVHALKEYYGGKSGVARAGSAQSPPG